MPDEARPIEFATFGEEQDIDQALADAAASGNVAAIALFDKRKAVQEAAAREKARELTTRDIVTERTPSEREGRAFDYAKDRAIVNESVRRNWHKNLDRLDRLMDQAEADTNAARKWAHPVEMAELSQSLVRTGATVCARMEAAEQGPAQNNHLHLHGARPLSELSDDELQAIRKLARDGQAQTSQGDPSGPQ